MKIVVGALAAALMFAGVASAQTTPTPPAAPPPPSTCAALQDPPSLPDGATASRQEMEQGDVRFQEWFRGYQASVVCRASEAAALRVQLEARIAEHNAAVERLNTINTAWGAEATEWNERNGARQRH